MNLLTILCLCLFYSSVQTERNREEAGTVKPGVCPPSSKRECFDQKADCEFDEDCGGLTKCCSNGCVSKCITPHYTGCQQLHLVTERRARSLGPEGESTFIPRCDKSGKFEPVQCNDISESCWCVNQQGFEIAGTRARALNLVNCSAPDKCAGHTCRMLCPYGFELDDYGCPICECRDPCKGVKCPANQKCEVEEVPCVDELCPPLPTCKQPRTLDSFCPVGEPITSPDSGLPFLCGMEPNKPQCPHSYLCNVLPGNDYGVCCPLVDKQGTCPSEVDKEDCGGSCQSDMDCVDVKKCCYTDVCGHTCVKPENTTLCLQQKAVVELLASNNAKFQGYVPQCTDTGEFLPKQCSTNGALCWCVDSTGVQVRGTIGPSSAVDCLLQTRSEQNPDATGCENATCDLHCEFGFQYDDLGCVKCECDDPCRDMECPHGSECIVLKEDPCMSVYCPPVASCYRTQSDMCSRGRPLLDNQTQELVHCGEKSCPLKTFVCERNPEDDMGVCCPASFVIESSKEGKCPQYVAEPRYCGNNTCTADEECEGLKKCCPSDVCGAICVTPEPKGLPTMCEYLHEMGKKINTIKEDEFLAISVPECREDGSYEPVQCNGDGECWCVDEFGVELNMTRASSFDQVDCRQVHARLECSGVLCRLGCDYGFEHDYAECPICACRNPCKDAKCPKGYECQMTEVLCEDIWCPPLPKCMRVKTQSRNSFPRCPTGGPMLNENDIPMICNPQIGVQQCPDTHVCLVPDPVTPGICCPRSGEDLSLVDSSEDNLLVSNSTEEQNVSSGEKEGSCPVVESWEVGNCAEECQVDSDCSGPQKCCTNGCAAHVCRDPAGTTGKPGQCPYLVPQSLGSCEYECTSDYDCEDTKKCCTNGCGTQCLVPLTLTTCQHQRAIAEYRAREAGIPASQVFLPVCDQETGVFEDVQCNPLTRECWCVDIRGYEVAGTRSLHGQATNCSGSTACPVLVCKLDCPAGLKLDENGCSLCECADPCRDVTCSSPVEECRLVQLTCITEPCPPVPLCLPPISNPCQIGEPLIDVNSGNELKCGPQGSQCPSSHRCHLSPFGEFAVCCPKPRDACFAEKDVGRCKSSIPRWFFNTRKNLCEEFRFGGCGGNLNNFNSREDCEKTCHALSHCEKLRERNLKYLKHSNGAVFIPKCNKDTGDWATVQCFDSIGLCWCASKDGEQVPGSIIRGTPHCTSRMGRTLDETSICPDEKPVYLCPADLCNNQHCLAHPNATCRVNPCGGCTPVFYDEMNHPVDCNDGLTTCVRKVQKVLNSHAWANQGLPLNRIEDFLPVKLQHSNNSLPSSPLHFSLVLTSKKDNGLKEQDIKSVVKRSAWNANPGVKIFFLKHAQRQREKKFEPKPPPTSIAFSSLIYGITDKSLNAKTQAEEKINVQTVEAQYRSICEKDDASSELSEGPPGYDNISDHGVKV
ncbi:balbiani ring protein 3-like [Limulus polyphemus]|uniref:Balbiani ring protein 3-like n=1 Tax=Limulus polyphemus TaxID=6850 RepID=A0ABM1TI64_LIMPO|nr:balbiani ring protein 3-like [Limulus polyphemus]